MPPRAECRRNTRCLPATRRAGSAALVGKRLIHLLILFATLCAGVPVLAHGHAAADIAIDVMGHGEVHAQAAEGDSAGQSRPADSPGHVAPHHHCSADLVSIGPALAEAFPITRDIVRPMNAAAMASRALAPPTEPPAA